MSLNTYMGVILVQILLALIPKSFGLFYLNILNDASFPSNLFHAFFSVFVDPAFCPGSFMFHLDTKGDISSIFCMLLGRN